MKHLIVCCDGTWNNPDQEDNGVPAPTNVFKLHNALAEETRGERQLKYYHPGVGAEGGLIDSMVGGAFGAGISRHICNAYHWLARNYQSGDAIYLFGFSRGAFTARSLGGFLGLGLLDLSGVNSREGWQRVHTAYEKGYRVKGSNRTDWAEEHWSFFHGEKPAPIRFIGVWDTVGALGIPDDLEVLNLFDDRDKWQFHNTELGEHVQTARHAMAIDEIRSSFSITRWSRFNTAETDAREVWFPGVHADVGGGYADCDLSDGALLWMILEAQQAGLKFRTKALKQIKPDPLGVMHNSYKGTFALLRSRPRNLPALIADNRPRIHSSALHRQAVSPIAYSAYRPTKILAVGASAEVDIYAAERWNTTGIYLTAGQYTFSAIGEWQDSKDTCDWKGTQDGELTRGDIARLGSSFIGFFDRAFKKITRNESFDLLWTKRVEKFNWFVLVGAIANDSGSTKQVKNDGSPVPHQYVDLTRHEVKALKVEAPGYLYCFPNDVWSLYDNNRGSVRLRVERVG